MEAPRHPNTLGLEQPKRFPITQVRADLKGLGIKLIEAGCQGGLLLGGDTGGLSGLISAIGGAAEKVYIQHPVEELAWELVRNALLRAMATLYDEGAPARPPAKGDVERLRSRIEFELAQPSLEIPHTMFKNPGALPVIATARHRFASWLRLIDLNEDEAASLANRLPNYLAFAFHEEWRSRRDHYQPVYEHYEGPFTPAVQMEWDWERNRRALIRQLDEPVFEETFSLRQVYVPLRAWWREEARDHQGSARGKKAHLHVVDLHGAVDEWLRSGDDGDTIRLISGGPGSGKSSFARKLAADLAEASFMRVLFFPLQRFPTRIPLLAAIESYLHGSDAFLENPIKQASFRVPIGSAAPHL